MVNAGNSDRNVMTNHELKIMRTQIVEKVDGMEDK